MKFSIHTAATFLLIGVSLAVAENFGTSSYGNVAKLISQSPRQRAELGLVRWGRDLDVAQKQSAESGKPILLLFQEVPG